MCNFYLGTVKMRISTWGAHWRWGAYFLFLLRSETFTVSVGSEGKGQLLLVIVYYLPLNTYPPKFKANRINDSWLNDLLSGEHSPRHSNWGQLISIGDINIALKK